MSAIRPVDKGSYAEDTLVVRLNCLHSNFMPDLSNSMPYLSASPQRGGAGIGLRGVARILLVSWLFTLAVCFYSDFHQTSTNVNFRQTSTNVVKDTPVAYEHNGLEHNDSDSTQEDDCCTFMENLPIFSKMGNIEVPLQNLVYVLLPYIFIFQTVLLVTARVYFSCTDPPGKPCHLLTANLLWPNAPPR